MDDSRTDLSGTTIVGRYLLEKQLGVGGYGAVYRAKHLAMGNDVAIKLLHATQSDPERAMRRFELEARRSASLKHPNTISVFDFGRTDDNRLFLAMEFLNGRPLGDIVREGELFSAGRVVHILGQVLRSLDEAHQKGFIHRDLKPDNIFLTSIGSETDFVKVLDFGIAKAVQSTSELTVTGTIIGTPMYMSPEQCRGRDLDGRSDLYSVGCIAYALLTGRPPFVSDNPVGYLLAHAESEPEDVRVVAGKDNPVPSGLAEWIHRLLAKAADDRYATAAEAGAALATCLTGEATWEFKQPLPQQKGMKRHTTTQSKMATRSDQKPVSTHDLALPAEPQKGGRGWIVAVVVMVLLGAGAAIAAIASGSGSGDKGQTAAAATTAPEKGKPEPTTKAAPETVAKAPEPATKAADPAATATKPPEPAPTNAPTDPPTVDPKTPLQVTVESEPAGAMVRVAGKDVGPAPQVVSWPRGEPAPAVELLAPGFAPLSVTLGDKDAGKDRVYTLTKIAAPPVASDKPKASGVASDKPRATTVVSDKPKPTTVVTDKPKPTDKPADKPKFNFDRVDDKAPPKPKFDRVE